MQKTKNTNVIVMGDININILSEAIQTEEYLNTLASNNLYLCDTKTITREASRTAIDRKNK